MKSQHAARASRCLAHPLAASSLRRFVPLSLALLLVVPLLVAVACESTPTRDARSDRTPREPGELRVQQSVGGTHYRTLMHGDRWYQTFGCDLLVLHPRSGREVGRLELARLGEAGPATEMLLHEDQLYVVLEDEAVVEVSIDVPDSPATISQAPSDQLGIRPRSLSVVNGHLYVSGVGGVVRWTDRARMFTSEDEVGRVAQSDEGLVTTIGRRIYRLSDGGYVGSASDLHEANIEGVEPGTMLFLRQIRQGAQLGLMRPNLREVDARDTTIVVPGTVRQIRMFDDRIWVVTGDEIVCYLLYEGRLVPVLRIDIVGAHDLAPLDQDYLVIAGSFGRTIYRVRSTNAGPGDAFLRTHREPSKLSRAKSDGRHILAGSDEGMWLYRIGSRVELVDEDEIDADDEQAVPQRTATALETEARISEDGMSLIVERNDRELRWSDPEAGRLHTVIGLEGRFWVGHDRGITVLEITQVAQRRNDSAAQQLTPHDSVRLDGPVRYLFPLRIGDGVAYVAEWGGFGTVTM